MSLFSGFLANSLAPESFKINASLNQLNRISANIMDSNMSTTIIALQRQGEAFKS